MQFDQHARRVSTSVSIFSIASWATGPGYVPCMISHSQSSCNVGFIRFNCQFKRKMSGYTRVAQHFPVHFLWILLNLVHFNYFNYFQENKWCSNFFAAKLWRHFNSESPSQALPSPSSTSSPFSSLSSSFPFPFPFSFLSSLSSSPSSPSFAESIWTIWTISLPA